MTRAWELLDLMKEFKVAMYLNLASFLEEQFQIAQSRGQDQSPSINEISGVRVAIEHITALCTEISLPVSIRQLRRITDLLDNQPPPTELEVARAFHELRLRIEDEINTHLFVQIEASRKPYYEASIPLFGLDVAVNFKSAEYDISEAGSCYAVGRNTACVMHLMRVAEVGLRALAADLSRPYDHDWGTTLGNLNDEVGKRVKAGTLVGADANFYREALIHFGLVKRFWRDTSMHIDKKYDDNDALRALNSTDTFMRHLATRLHE